MPPSAGSDLDKHVLVEVELRTSPTVPFLPYLVDLMWRLEINLTSASTKHFPSCPLPSRVASGDTLALMEAVNLAEGLVKAYVLKLALWTSNQVNLNRRQGLALF